MNVRKSPERQNLTTVMRSFGYTVLNIQDRMMCLAPGDDTIFVIRQLRREGFWELNVVDRFMWEKYGAMGYPIKPYISQNELIELMYHRAAAQEGIKQGLVLDPKDAFRQTTFESATERLNRRVREMYLDEDISYLLHKPIGRAREIKERMEQVEARKNIIREALAGKENDYIEARRKIEISMKRTPRRTTRPTVKS